MSKQNTLNYADYFINSWYNLTKDELRKFNITATCFVDVIYEGIKYQNKFLDIFPSDIFIEWKRFVATKNFSKVNLNFFYEIAEVLLAEGTYSISNNIDYGINIYTMNIDVNKFFVYSAIITDKGITITTDTQQTILSVKIQESLVNKVKYLIYELLPIGVYDSTIKINLIS